jgi:hypothetical protein
MNVRFSKSKAGSLGSAFFCLFPSVINSKINFSLQDRWVKSPALGIFKAGVRLDIFQEGKKA